MFDLATATILLGGHDLFCSTSCPLRHHPQVSFTSLLLCSSPQRGSPLLWYPGIACSQPLDARDSRQRCFRHAWFLSSFPGTLLIIK